MPYKTRHILTFTEIIMLMNQQGQTFNKTQVVWFCVSFSQTYILPTINTAAILSGIITIFTVM